MAKKACSIPGCATNAVARGWCNKHYLRWQKYGDPAYAVDERKATRIVDLEDGRRVCGTCGETKPLTEFHKDKRNKSGYRGDCKPCRNSMEMQRFLDNPEAKVAYAAERRKTHTDLIRKQDSERYERNKAKRIELATKHFHIRRARILSRETDNGITVKRLRKMLGSTCPYCGQDMIFTPGKQGEYQPRRASIEHITPISKGGTHTWDNVILTCLECNITRGNREAPIPIEEAGSLG